MKKILFMLLVGALLVTPALAIQCEEGYHWQESITEGYYTDGECISWSETECIASHEECIDSHENCTNWYWHWGWHCSNYETVCDEYETVCDAYSEATCLEYEQVWHEPVDEGECVLDEPTEPPVEEPYCGDGVCDEGEDSENCSEDCGECPIPDPEPEEPKDPGGGVSIYNYRTKISDDNFNVVGRCISFMSSHWGYGGLLVDDISHEYYLDEYHQLLPVYMGSIMSMEPVSVLGSNNNYGYEYNYTSDAYGAYHTICLPESGAFYIRPYLTNYDNPWNFIEENGTIYGSEHFIFI